MPSLAHEGNPKEASIAISAGSVLSTAQLDVDFRLFQDQSTPQTVDSNRTVISSSCSDVFEWIGRNDNSAFLGSEQGRDWIYFSDGPCLSSTGNRTKWADTTSRLRINSTPTCYGVLWQKLHPTHYPNANKASCSVVTWFVGFNGIIDGTPRCGPALWITDASLHGNASLYAMVFDGDANNIKLCRWVGASLASLDNATTLGTINVAPSIGNMFVIKMSQRPDTVGSNFVIADLRTSDYVSSLGSTQFNFDDTTQQAIYNQSGVRHNRCGVGFVSIGGVTSGKAEWVHSANESCWDGLVPFVDIDSSGGT